MNKQIGYLLALVTALAVLLTACDGVPISMPGSSTDARTPTAEFGLAERTFIPTGRNQYFILEPGFQLVLDDQNEHVEVTVTDETKQVDGVVTRVIVEKVWSTKGELMEVARNFFAIDEKTKDVFYFGEEVDNYQGGKVINHNGSWLAGENGAKPGMIMPAQPKVGMKYFQEVSPGVAMDYATIIDLNVTVRAPAGTFTNCVRTEEGSAVNPLDKKEIKIYAPGVGLVQSGDLVLTKYGTVR